MPRITDIADADGEFAVLDDAVCGLVIAVAVECETGGIDVVGHEVTFVFLCVDIDATSLFAIVRCTLVIGSIEAAVDAVLCIGIANLVGIDAQHRCCEVAHEELCRDDIGAVDEAFVTCTWTIEGLCRQCIDAIAQAREFLTDLKLHIVSSSYGEDVGEATIMHHVEAALCATLGDGPALPCFSIVELGIDDERGEVGAFGSAAQDGCSQELLGKAGLCCELLGIKQALIHNI